jgi:hypothetical protein
VNFRERLAARTAQVRNRPFDLGAELRVLAVGLFAVAAAALWLNRSEPVTPVEVAGGVLVVLVVFAVNVTVGLAGARRMAREQAGADGMES